MEGNYYFEWQAVDATGAIEGKYEQSIYGEDLHDACINFTAMHGDLHPDENGVCLQIVCITWQPA
jgi:hypothetical protein